ncbi:MAG: ATP-binding domain-containing protein [Firmicutes bacterium]|nr:ATP-binding domain-containing protein [Bacillota bacterium]
MSSFVFLPEAWGDYVYWQGQDKKTLRKINLILQDISRNALPATRHAIIDYLSCGLVKGVGPATEALYSATDLDDLTLAYAITINKAQGSEYPAVIMPLTTSHYIMLARNLVYTAVTCATQKACIVGTRKAHAIALKNNAVQMRYTKLGG